MTQLLKDVLVIPERSGAEDYVLRLSDSVEGVAARAALDEYVVTDDLAGSFDRALGLVAEAVTSGTSRGAFLTGSFGSGKSHFMAVMHALLRHDPTARAKEELHGVIAHHDPVLRQRRVLPLVFHLLGASSMEEAVFNGYERQIRTLHPDAPLPALHASDGVLADAERMRARDGDERFFTALNGDGPADDAWAALLGSGTWTAQTYDAARAAAPGSPERQQLVTALADTFFSSYTRQADYVDLDTGLAAISQHAAALGYDAVVLLLDELVLWLAFAVQDREFFRRESQKLTKLVESSTGTRAVPLVSFVARQLDLRRWFADAGATGAEQEALDRAFRHQEGRFATIELGNDNLPYVANRRVLRRRDAAAEVALSDAFDQLERRPGVWDVLLDGVNTDERHRGADEKAFRLTYPFSPALVSTLRSLAGVMQRERTALKVMQKMLVDRRETLTVDHVIPVGDAYDDIVTGEQALDSAVAAKFRSATALYQDKLRPVLLAAYGLTAADLAGPASALPAGYHNDDRIAKTLLLAAVAPNVPALKEITASRLASLNHGSIVSPLPGGEVATVLAKVKEWGRQIPEIAVDPESRNPVIRVKLSDVDYETVVERAKGEDNEGRRRELVRDLVREALALDAREPDVFGAYRHSIVWRGSRREVDVVFGNVRDAGWLSEDHFRARPDTWRVVVDHPFDDAGHSAAEDLARLDRMVDAGLQSRTIVWLPRFLTEERMRDVRRLVVLDWVLGGAGERWASHADHLSEVDRITAKSILEQDRAARKDGLRRVIQEAYAAAAPISGAVIDDPSHDRVFVSLDRGFTPAPPVGADLAAAFRALLDQALAASHPAHPRFEPAEREVTVRELTAVYEHVERAVADPDGRVRLEGDTSGVRRVATTLGVGTAGETHFLFGDDRLNPWNGEFERAASRDGVAPHQPVTVGQVRGWITALVPDRGLRPEVSDLVVLAWAALRQRAWFHHGGPVPVPKPGALRAEMELRTQPLPTPEEWQRAVARAQTVFGIVGGAHLTARGLTAFAGQVTARAAESVDAAVGLVPALDAAYRRIGVEEGETTGRFSTARAASSLLQDLRGTGEPVQVVQVLARTKLPVTEAVLATSISQARTVSVAVEGFRWERLEAVRKAATGTDQRAAGARRILEDLQGAVRGEEFSASLAIALRTAESASFDWLARHQPPPESPPESPRPQPPGPGPRPQAPYGTVRRGRGDTPELALDALKAVLAEHPDADVVIDWHLEE